MKSNSTIPEAERRARGQARLQLRVDAQTVSELEALCAATGRTHSAQVSDMIRDAVKRNRRRAT